MSRVRNATEFSHRLHRAREDYERVYRRQVEEVRAQYADNPTEEAPPEIDESLEAHLRQYFVNGFLNALNWRLDFSPHDGLPNLIPESPIASLNRGTVRFLDYLGAEGEDHQPLLIVETKRPSSGLPKRKKALVKYERETPGELICAGLGGDDLGAEWNEWLATLRDYVRSVHARSGRAPRRVVITNGRWLVLFADPADSFLEAGARSPENVFVYHESVDETRPDEIEERAEELFDLLEHQRVLNRTPPLVAGEIAFHVRPELIDRALHGLHLKYIEQNGIYSVSPVIQVSPVLFLRSRFGAWTWVESRWTDDIPHAAEQLPGHLERVRLAASRLLGDVNGWLGAEQHTPASLESHYADAEGFEVLRGVTEIRRGQQTDRSQEVLVITGANTHYLLEEPTVPDCPYHDWVRSRDDGYEAGDAGIYKRSTVPRSFFISGEPHHCAHRDVAAAKASQITRANRERCGPRSGKDLEAFCEIWRFEEHLCCRVCAFQDVCTKAQVFTLPCRRPADGH